MHLRRLWGKKSVTKCNRTNVRYKNRKPSKIKASHTLKTAEDGT